VRPNMKQQLFLHTQLVYFAGSMYQARVLVCAMQVLWHCRDSGGGGRCWPNPTAAAAGADAAGAAGTAAVRHT
jgi:hypothetical protein